MVKLIWQVEHKIFVSEEVLTSPLKKGKNNVGEARGSPIRLGNEATGKGKTNTTSWIMSIFMMLLFERWRWSRHGSRRSNSNETQNRH